ncbi:LacI family DNA-binding transcriptional regulator [Kiritimatiellaeota bacterium B1221]|nr:LacI family DNA-binding transcriptional regulator [Kiritimatiellaeota bacterium B1221]
MTPSQTEIARKLGVSQRTVSAVINNNGRISDETRERVAKACEEMGYQPNRMASGLRGSRTHAIGAIWPVADPWAGDSAISLSLVKLLNAENLATYSAPATQDLDVLCSQIHELAGRGVDALFLHSIPSLLSNEKIVNALKAIPAVVAVSREEVSEFPGELVVHDRYNAMREVVAHFAKTGRKRVSILIEPTEESNPPKIEVFRQACRDYGLEEHEHTLIPMPKTTIPREHSEQHRNAIINAFPGEVSVDAIFCVNDVGALYVMRELQDRGIRIPEDVAIVGLNNAPTGVVWAPALATIDRMHDQVAQEVFQCVTAKIANPDAPKQTRFVHMKFIPRTSAG